MKFNFQEAVPIARLMNYTLVVPPFHRHPRMELFVVDQKTAEKDKYEPKVNVPIFDTMYEERFRKLSINYRWLNRIS